jgi:hypothetical protein
MGFFDCLNSLAGPVMKGVVFCFLMALVVNISCGAWNLRTRVNLGLAFVVFLVLLFPELKSLYFEPPPKYGFDVADSSADSLWLLLKTKFWFGLCAYAGGTLVYLKVTRRI